MRKPLAFKLLFSYIVFTLFIFIFVNTIAPKLFKNQYIEDKKNTLYEEASIISCEYMTNYYKRTLSLEHLEVQLKTVDTFLDSRIWIADSSGIILLDSRKTSKTAYLNINKVDPDFLKNDYCTINSKLDNIISTPMLSVIHPISYEYKIKGYIIMHYPLEKISRLVTKQLDTLNICLLIFSVLLALVFAYIYIITVLPLRKLKKAALKYTSGYFDYPLELKPNDEYRDLSHSLTYMAGEINSLDEYQKTFVANISHDFRSPLTSIKGYAEAILDGTIPVEIQDKYINIILFETERLTKLTTNLLTLNGFENKGTILDITSFDINSMIKQTSQSFEGICTKKEIILNLTFSNENSYVNGDFGKIQQVLYNLLDNAIKFSHNSSFIDISTEERNEKLFVSVKDYGLGIPKESMKKVWERFYKTDTSRGKDKKGTGLGLSITKEIISAHNENINVTSTEGVGTEFTFSLPITK